MSTLKWKGFIIIPINHFVCEAEYDYDTLNSLETYPPINLSYSNKNLFGFEYNFLTEDSVILEDIYQECENLITWFNNL